MKVKILRSFTGYPNGKRKDFQEGSDDLPKAFVDEANLVSKGLIEIAEPEAAKTEGE